MSFSWPFPNPHDPDAVRRWNAAHRADLDAVRRWMAPLLARAERLGDVPALGTAPWRALPDNDPRKLAALARTALHHLAENTEEAIAARMRAELDKFATAVRRIFADANREASAYARERRLAGYETGPTHAELVRRRNTFRCWHCHIEVYGPVTCPNGCGTPDQIRAHATASWPGGREGVAA